MDAAGVLRWRDAYDAAGILDDSHPPRALIEEAPAEIQRRCRGRA